MGMVRSCQHGLGLIFLATLVGCQWGQAVDPVSPRPQGTLADLEALAARQNSAAMRDTIGFEADVQGARFMRVRGYGLVVGLAGTGSSNCTPSIREHLAREIRRARMVNFQEESRMTAEELIDSRNTAVVEVVGDIPAGASKGHVFDVVLSSASFDPDTQSLTGGYLLSCELKMYRDVSPEERIEGRTLARARGPVFLNPFAQGEGQSAGVNLREGRVLAGAIVTEDRELSLVTAIDSYSKVSQIQNAINRRFPSTTKVADGVSATMVKLNIPPEYHGREGRFLEIVRHLSTASSGAAREVRIKELIAELKRPDAPLDDVALSLEGIGSPALDPVKALYGHHRREVNYYAARTGLRLGDVLAIDVIARHARDVKSPFRVMAIRELGDSGNALRAGIVLRELLASSDPTTQIMAYEALRKVDPDSVYTRLVGREPENFLLDVVPADGPMLIYARRSKTRRIALIGGDRLVLRPPLLYSEPGKPVVLSAGEEDDLVSLIRKDAKGRNLFGRTLRVAPALPKFVHFLGHDAVEDEGQILGLGLDYGAVIDVLDRLCRSHAIDAEFRWEEPGIEDLAGPLKPLGRPESEL